MQNFNFPIVIFCSNRHDYFKCVVDSLLVQSINFDRTSVYLFSDSSGCKDSLQNIEYFSEKFSFNQIILDCRESKGIANSRWIAENYVFKILNAEWALFLEDDLFLDPCYLESLLQIYTFFNENKQLDKVAKFASYGPLDHGDVNFIHDAFITLKHSWGTLESKRQWEIALPLLDFYTELVNKFGYNTRIHSVILSVYNLLGFSWNFEDQSKSMTSQDNFRTALNLISAKARVNTSLCYAHYIGAIGVNFNHSDYLSQGFGVNKITGEKLDNKLLVEWKAERLDHSILSSQVFLYSNARINSDVALDPNYIDIVKFDKSYDEFLMLSFHDALSNFNSVVIDELHDSLNSVVFSLSGFLRVSESVLSFVNNSPGRLVLFVTDRFPQSIFFYIVNSNLDLYLFVDKSSHFYSLLPFFDFSRPVELWHQLNFYDRNGVNVVVFNPAKYIKVLNE